MSKKSFLLAVSGSEQALYAAETCWELANIAKASVTGLHVINTKGAWDLLNNGKPGLVGSGLNVAAYESILDALRLVSDKLAQVYEAKATAPGQLIIEEGDPVERITTRAQDCDLVVLGHAPTSKPSELEDHLSVAERVSQQCTVPVLIVQRKSSLRSLRMVTTAEHINHNYLTYGVQMARALQIKPEILCLTTGIHEKDPARVVHDLRGSEADLKDVRITFHHIENYAIADYASAWWVSEKDVEADNPDTSLLAIPTRHFAEHRVSVFGTAANYVVRNLQASTVLLWPEEYTTDTVDRLATVRSGNRS
jgi:nucleotide-binding universal stress UspA family protein